MPWDSVRVDVVEDLVREDQRVLAYLFNPQLARWTTQSGPPPPHRSSRATLRSDGEARAAAKALGVVLTNRWFEHPFSARVALSAATGPQTFHGHAFGPSQKDVPLGAVVSERGGDGVWGFNATLDPLQIQFWVEA